MLLWVAAIIALPLLALYVVLLFTPIPLPFMRDQVRNAAMAALPASASLQLGNMALALENGSWPVLQFSPVVYTDAKTGGKVQMKALDVGFSPFRALIGQPGAIITMVAPHLQVNQDLLGPRLANFQVIGDPRGGRSTVRVLEGSDSFPSVGISASGLSVTGTMPNGAPAGLRSDNDWLIYNMEAMQQSLGSIVEQAQQGRFSRLIVKDGVMDMNDAVYGLYRQFSGIDLDVSPGLDGKSINGSFSADFAGQTMRGEVARTINKEGGIHLSSDITNIDFSAFMPFINDPDGLMGVVGTGALSIDVDFDGKSGKATGGVFHADLTGMDFRIGGDHFPIVTSVAAIQWTPSTGQFALAPADLRIGKSSAKLSGVFALGLDRQYGPTAGISIKASEVRLQPDDMAPPEVPFDQIDFSGWSAPLYGALGIDELVASKPGGQVEGKGRIDMLRSGFGFNLHVGGSGITADDLKRLWPYFLSTEARSWFVKNVTDGRVQNADMQFSFPVGSVGKPGEKKPSPPHSIAIDVVGTGVKMKVLDALPAIAADGQMHVEVRDNKLTVSAEAAHLPTSAGNVALATPAVVLDSSNPDSAALEVSGELKSEIPALLAVVKEVEPNALATAKLPLDPDALGGGVDVSLVTNLTLDAAGGLKSFDYAANGTAQHFASSAPIAGHAIRNGQISFTASQAGYQATGTADIDGFNADVKVDGTPTTQPQLLLSSTLDTKALKSLGFDVSSFLDGPVRFVARPMPDNSIQMAVDISDAALKISDLGLSKPKGVSGMLEAAVTRQGTLTQLSQVKLNFGSVDLQGSIQYDDKKGLQAAQFTTFQLSPGDKAQLALAPIRDGFALHLVGEQLDLKPMLQHFFGLGGGTGGPQSTLVSQKLALDLDLKRALGFYKTTAYNMQLQIELQGSTINRASLQGQFGNGRSVSVATNPTSEGRVMSVAFNDLGTLLRFGGVYSRIEGGEGSLVMNTGSAGGGDQGVFDVHDFALVNESNAAQVLESHAASRQLVARENKLSFASGHVQFVRRSDRIEIVDGVLTGDTVGGTMRGFIYTQRRQYDLAGTYVPLFGLNSIFQKLPLFGPLLGGRNGEGLIGVTFAIRGSLDHPNFQINPASLLVPGAFRELFEYRAKELPEAPAPAGGSGN